MTSFSAHNISGKKANKKHPRTCAYHTQTDPISPSYATIHGDNRSYEISWPHPERILTRISPWLVKQRWFPGQSCRHASIVYFRGFQGVNEELTHHVRTLVIGLSKSSSVSDTTITPSPTSTSALTSPQSSSPCLSDKTLIHVPLVITIGNVSTPGYICSLYDQESRSDTYPILVDGPYSSSFLQAWVQAIAYEKDFYLLSNKTTVHHSLLKSLSSAKALNHEQSNTSILFPHSHPLACAKFFRVLTQGDQPEVSVPQALTREHWSHVPSPLGASYLHISGSNERLCTSYIYEFIDPGEDGFEYISRRAKKFHVSKKEDMPSSAADLHELGRTTACLHRHLLQAFGPGDTMTGVLLAQRINEQRDLALSAYPSLEKEKHLLHHIDRFSHAMNALGCLPPTQRVHGDFHLGQCLWTGEKWYILDFEGEPLRPAYERVLPDQVARDIAGLLRSLDYAAHEGKADPAWLNYARHSFLSGYFGSYDYASSPYMLVVTAFEVEKALYEVRYEALHRPSWVFIPLHALKKLLIPVDA